MTKINTSKEWIQILLTANASNVTTTKITTKTQTFKPSENLIGIPLDKLFEFYGNLILNNFSVSEALKITAEVAASARTI